jgi:hypothetical protein
MTIRSEPTLTDLLKSFWDARIFIAAGAGISLVIAALLVLLCTPLYRAEMIVAPADGYALGDYASSSTVDRSISLPFWRPMEPEGISTDFYRFVYTVQEPAVAAILMKDKKVVAGIREDNRTLRRLPVDKWTPALVSEYFVKKIKVEPLGATALRRLTYNHPNPEFAADLLRKVHLVADQMIRRDRRRQSQSRVDYLKEALGKTNHPDHRKGITDLLMQQEHVQMLANLDEAYAAIVVEPASSSARPVWPRRALILPLFLLMGMAGGFSIWSCCGRRWRLKDEQ